jgi:cobalt/nickel transport system permease protein
MRHNFLDKYGKLHSPVHHLPAQLKFWAVIGILFLTISFPISFFSFFIAEIIFLLVLAAFSKIPPGFLFRRILFLEPFVLGVAVLSLFQPNGETIFVTILIKSTFCLFTVILFSNTTPFSELLGVLRRIHTPAILVTILSLMYRYVFVLIDELERMKRARLSRTFVQKRVHIWRAFTSILGQLFVRSSERAERIYHAMVSRGWK